MITAFVEANGIVVGAAFGDAQTQPPRPELSAVIVERMPAPGLQYVKDGDVFDLPEKPGDWAKWDLDAEAWVDPRTQAEIDAAEAATATAETEAKRRQIDAERDRRIALGFAFGGKVIQFRPEDKQRVTGAGALAGFAVASGAQPGDLRWHGGAADFEWITADNTTLALDAVGMFAMSQAAAAHESAHVFAARALKNADPIPSDFTDDSYWPVRP